MDKIIVIKGLGVDYVSPSLPVHIDPHEWRRSSCSMCCVERKYRKKNKDKNKKNKQGCYKRMVLMETHNSYKQHYKTTVC